MNIFSTDLFLETAGALFYPRAERRIETFMLENRVLRLLVADGKVVRTMPFYDYPQPVDLAPPGAVLPLSFFPRTVVSTTLVEERVPEQPGFQPSPYIEWARVGDWETYLMFIAERATTRHNDTARQKRRLAKDVGPLSFVFDDQRPEVFDALVRWKSAQYVSTGVGDMFARPANVELFRQLQAKKAVVVSSLSAGSTLLAAHFGSLTDARMTWWVPAYDPAHSKYSPGRLMLEMLLEESHKAKHLEFDFLIGDEGYKFNFATHNRLIGPVGTPALRERVLSRAKKEAKSALKRFPKVYELAREVGKRLRGPP